MKNISLIFCSLFPLLISGCTGQEEKPHRKSTRTVAVENQEQKLDRRAGGYGGSGTWRIVDGDGSREYRKFMVGVGDGPQRVIELEPNNGYLVHRIILSCKKKAYDDRGAPARRLSRDDASPPIEPANTKRSVPTLNSYIDALCSDKKDPKNFTAPLNKAVKRLRDANNVRVRPTVEEIRKLMESTPKRLALHFLESSILISTQS